MSDIRLIQLSNYVRPKLDENKSKNWVLNGPKNSFYQYIIDRNNGSVTNSTINNSYTDLIYGRGLAAKDAHLKPETWAAFVSMLTTKDLKRVIADFQLFREASLQIVYNNKHDKITGVYHLPKNKVVPSLENEDGEIETYWYCKDWSNPNKNTPEEFPAFGTSKKGEEIYVIKPYTPGMNYFGSPDYMAGLPYAEMEEELANFFINTIKQGISAGYIINIPDGVSLTSEQKNEIELKIKQKLTGSPNAQKFIINFGGSKEAEITIVPFPVNEQQHKQWDVLTAESRQQLMTAHKVVSPMLFGIKDNTGFGNNANELDEAEAQLVKRVIAPKQQFIIDALHDILAFNGISLDLYFKPLTEQKATSGVQLSAHDEKKNLDTSVADGLIQLGEDVTEDWELVESKLVTNYDTDVQFTSTGTAIPNARSAEDGEQYKVRFRYTGELSSNSREFCRKMITANKLYRLEDINKMSTQVVNEGWGPNGANTYDIFLYKGGGGCHHGWQREVYKLKADVNSPLAEKIPQKEAKEDKALAKVNSVAAKLPVDMPNQGFLKKR